MPPSQLRSVLERLAYVVWVGMTAISLGATILSPWFPWPEQGLPIAVYGFSGFALSRLLHQIGHEHWHFAEHEGGFEVLASPGGERLDQGHEQRANDLRRLLLRWDDLDARREEGDDTADVWQVHAIRQETRTLLRADPALRYEFDREIARHPGLGDC